MNYQQTMPQKKEDDRFSKMVRDFKVGNLLRGMADPSFSGWAWKPKWRKSLPPVRQRSPMAF